MSVADRSADQSLPACKSGILSCDGVSVADQSLLMR